MPNDSPVLSGGCQCGTIRYSLSQGPQGLYVCHCRKCRKQSASAFGISVIVPQTALHVVQGAPKFWSRPTDTRHVLDCAFCPECGSRLWHQRRGSADTLSIKGGSLDKDVDLSQAVHIWTLRTLRGVVLPEGAKQFPGEPDDS